MDLLRAALAACLKFHCRTEPDHFRKQGLWKGPTKSEFQQIPEYNINFKINRYSPVRWSVDNNWTRTSSLHLHNPLPRTHPYIRGYCSERGVTDGNIHCGGMERWGDLIALVVVYSRVIQECHHFERRRTIWNDQ